MACGEHHPAGVLADLVGLVLDPRCYRLLSATLKLE